MLSSVPLRATLGAACALVHLPYITPYDGPVFNDPLLAGPLVIGVALLLHALVWSGMPRRVLGYVALSATLASLPSVYLQSTHGYSQFGVYLGIMLGVVALLSALSVWGQPVPSGPRIPRTVPAADRRDVAPSGSANAVHRAADLEAKVRRGADTVKELQQEKAALQRRLGAAERDRDRLANLLAVQGDRWVIVRRLPSTQQGGMSTVFEVRSTDPADDGRYAMKVAELGNDTRRPHDQHRLLREANVLRDVGPSPHVIEVVDVQLDAERGIIYLVTPFFEHGTLEEHLQASAPRRTLGWWRERIVFLLEGVDAFHRAGFIHRDIKPANLFMDLRLLPVLADPGLARVLGPEQVHRTISLTGWASHGYAAPEQALPAQVIGPRGRVEHVLDERVDLYAVGALLYKLLTGWRPYETEIENDPDDWVTLMFRGPTLPLPTPRELNPRVPTALSDLVCSLVAFDRARRALGGDGRTLSAIDIASALTTMDLGAAGDLLLSPQKRDESLPGRLRTTHAARDPGPTRPMRGGR